MNMDLSLEEVKILIDVMYEYSKDHDVFSSGVASEDISYWKQFDVIWARLINLKVQMEAKNVAG